MNKSVALFVSILILSLVIVSLPQSLVVMADSKTIVVPDDYSTISCAIGNATEGDTIFVKSGTYYERLVIDKSVFLKGENNETTKIHRLGQAYPEVYPTIVVRANNVTITGLTILNEISYPFETTTGKARSHTGIHLLDVNHCNVFDNIIINCGYGVWIFGSTNNNIFRNEITNVSRGIVVQKSSSNIICENWDSNIEIIGSSNNTIIENAFSGITIDGSSNNSVHNNTVSNSNGGILLSSATSNILRNNSITNASRNFGISGTELAHFLNDIDTSNTINSDKIYYFINKTNLTIDPVLFPDLGALIIVNCTNVDIQNLNMTQNYCGVNLFSISNCKVINNTFSYNSANGINLQFVKNCEISNNTLTKNTGTAISVSNSENFQISQNNLTCHNSGGIAILSSNKIIVIKNDMKTMQDGGGIYLGGSNNNTIVNNNLSNGKLGLSLSNSSHNFLHSNFISYLESYGSNGIRLDDGSNFNRIIGNSFVTKEGNVGVKLSESCFNSFIENSFINYSRSFDSWGSRNNTIARNTIQSRELAFRFCEFHNNSIYNNNILGKTRVWDWGRDAANAKISVNQWYNGTNGNYWSDNKGIDNNKDGIADKPYIIDEDAQDNYPLMDPVEIETEPIEIEIGPIEFETVPEFPAWAILPLIGLAMITVTVFRKKYTKHQQQN